MVKKPKAVANPARLEAHFVHWIDPRKFCSEELFKHFLLPVHICSSLILRKEQADSSHLRTQPRRLTVDHVSHFAANRF